MVRENNCFFVFLPPAMPSKVVQLLIIIQEIGEAVPHGQSLCNMITCWVTFCALENYRAQMPSQGTVSFNGISQPTLHSFVLIIYKPAADITSGKKPSH